MKPAASARYQRISDINLRYQSQIAVSDSAHGAPCKHALSYSYAAHAYILLSTCTLLRSTCIHCPKHMHSPTQHMHIFSKHIHYPTCAYDLLHAHALSYAACIRCAKGAHALCVYAYVAQVSAWASSARSRSSQRQRSKKPSKKGLAVVSKSKGSE